jgi:hypothetical protein
MTFAWDMAGIQIWVHSELRLSDSEYCVFFFAPDAQSGLILLTHSKMRLHVIFCGSGEIATQIRSGRTCIRCQVTSRFRFVANQKGAAITKADMRFCR